MTRFVQHADDKKIGVCIHLVVDFVCSYGKHQNYPCPYRNKTSGCSSCVPFTERMAEELNAKGYFTF